MLETAIAAALWHSGTSGTHVALRIGTIVMLAPDATTKESNVSKGSGDDCSDLDGQQTEHRAATPAGDRDSDAHIAAPIQPSRSHQSPPPRSPPPHGNDDNDSDDSDNEQASRRRSRVLDAKLVLSVRRVTRSGRRADYADAVHVHASRLTRVPLAVHCDVDTAQAFRDASREDIMLNGVCFVGDYRTEAFVAAVKRIVARHVEQPETYLAVTDRIMRGCSRTLSGADSYFALDELFASPDVLIKPRDSKPVPLSVTLGLDCSDQRFRCRIKSTNVFALYRHVDIEAALHCDALTPLVALDTIVVEHLDLTTNKSHRHLTITLAASAAHVAVDAPSRRLALELAELF